MAEGGGPSAVPLMPVGIPVGVPAGVAAARPTAAAKIRLEKKHPLAVRWMHWINFPVLFTMIWSGLLIYWGDSDNAYQHPHRIYRIGIGSWTVFRFFPDWVYQWLNAPYQITKGLGWHFFFMWIFAINGVLYVTYLTLSGNWRLMVPTMASWKEAIEVTLFDLHLSKKHPPAKKYNGAQKIAYSAIVLMGLGSLLTGLAIYKPSQAHYLTSLLGGYEMARWEHFWLTIGFMAFFVLHVGQVVKTGWNNFRGMVSGYEVSAGGLGAVHGREEAAMSDEQKAMSDGREEREEREKRRELEERESREDRVDREHGDEWEQERVDSKAASAGEAVVEGAAGTTDEGAAQVDAMRAVQAEVAAENARAAELDAAIAAGAEQDRAVRAESGKHTRRSFLVAAAGVVAAYEGYKWLDNSPMVGRQQAIFRKAWATNSDVAQGVFGERGIAPTFAKEKAVADLRFNGPYGLRQEIVLDSWRLKLVGVENPKQYKQYVPDVTAWEYKEVSSDAMKKSIAGGSGQSAPADDSKGPAEKPAEWTRALNGDGTPMRGQEEAGDSDNDLDPFTPGLLLTLDDVKKLPRHEMVTEFKCIEGWSEIVHWGGVRLVDLINAYPPAKNAQGRVPRYVYMETPYGDYYCGYNMAACMHPQSLLTMEMSGQPLTQNHGAPLRLHMPIKYGYKQIKRIALIAYTDKVPDDYWTKLGYDWYAGL